VPTGASTFLGDAGNTVPTAVGIKYGSSRNNAYLNLRPLADTASAPSTTTYTFAAPSPSTGESTIAAGTHSAADVSTVTMVVVLGEGPSTQQKVACPLPAGRERLSRTLPTIARIVHAPATNAR
jgi:hypothetical protein